jgi:hypothetical protein
MAASRDCVSASEAVEEEQLRCGNDDVQDDMLEARVGVRKGCDGGRVATEAIDSEEMDEV